MTAKVDVLLGLQWGDEGKGKIVDVLAPKYKTVARFQGGPNAGHTLEFDNEKYVLHQIPSGIFRKGVCNIIGNGVVINPVIFKKEIENIQKVGIDIVNHLLVSNKIHLILPTHISLDQAYEINKGDKKIGSTKKGIGPTYTDKIARNGVRVGDIFRKDFKSYYAFSIKNHNAILEQMGYKKDISKAQDEFFEAIEFLKKFNILDTSYVINNSLTNGDNILAEGAQGSLLDIDFGSYPFVTSSNTTISGVCSGLGVAPKKIGKVMGIFKAYCTRVGSGPFPTELFDKIGVLLQEKGNEFGATTGRPRRCGWLDLPALKYAIMLNGVDELYMMKGDVMDSFEHIKICTHYLVNGEKTEQIPFDSEIDTIKPIYKELEGWKQPISDAKHFNELPNTFVNYIKFIEQQVQIPIKIISVGPNRNQTLFL